MKKCAFCGREYSDDRNRCPACGVEYNENSAKKPAPNKSEQRTGLENLGQYVDFMSNDDLFSAGLCYKSGVAVKKDLEKSKEYFHILALKGNHDAMYQYAEVCLNGTSPDVDSAIHWLSIAAKQGHISSKLKLAELIALGVVKTEISATASYASIFDEKADASAPTGSALEARVRNALPFIVTITVDKGSNSRSLGSGFVIDGGLVLTNAHVVGDNPKHVTARFEPSIDSKPYDMRCLGVFPNYDIAVLKFSNQDVEKFARRKSLSFRLGEVRYGEEVYTIGNPLGLGFSVNSGVVSSPNRQTVYGSVHDVIQVSITANHGNSGGALLDTENKVLGLVTYVPSASDGGITMCIPSKYAVQVLNTIKL